MKWCGRCWEVALVMVWCCCGGAAGAGLKWLECVALSGFVDAGAAQLTLH